ncbi:hypothetical protein JTB14_026473 [Gonioctena quinquepunctata]|nr:hypothetical protein JTB14_026473 [Gonioctena quinquepunctata]
MDDEADLQKMIEVLKNSKQESDAYQYEDFINYDNSDVEETYNDDNSHDLEQYEIPSVITNPNLISLYKYNPISSLKPEEKQAIDSCTDPELKNLLILNRQKTMQLIQFYKKIKDMLIECKQNIVEKNEIIKECIESKKALAYSSGAWRLGAPYFKDKQLYCCPSNEDTLRKRRNQELSVYDLQPLSKWSSYECDTLLSAVRVNYNINQQNEVRKKIKEISLGLCKDSQEELAELEERLQELEGNGNREVPPLGSDKNIDWPRVADVFINNKHSEFECRSFWHIFLHPSVNKSLWTSTENEKLQEVARKYNYQQWDRIAEEIGNNRSGLTACINYFGNMHNRFKKGEFTFAEDKKILELVNKFKMGKFIPWVKIAKHFKHRSRGQIHHRYTYYLSQGHRKSGKFSDAEDILILICVDKFGKNFKKCSEYLYDRSITQIKSRYTCNLMQCVKKGTWTLKEDKIIMEYVKANGRTSWTALAKQMSRSRGQLRQRYLVIEGFLRLNPNSTIEDVTRRKHNWSTEEQEFMFLRRIADQYQDKPFVPTLEEIERLLKPLKRGKCMKMDSEAYGYGANEDNSDIDIPDSKNVDDMLTDFFNNCYKVEEEIILTPKALKEAVDDVELLMDLLKVNLELPENLSGFKRLDSVDVEILQELSQRRGNCAKTYSPRTRHIADLVPPNLHSTIGLRSLLIKNQHFMYSSNYKIFEVLPKSSVSRLKFEIGKQLSALEAKEQAIVQADRKLCYSRFHSLLKWPALMTLEGPTSELRHLSENIKEEIRPPVKRTYSRMKKIAGKDIAEDPVANKKPKLSDSVQPVIAEPVTSVPSVNLAQSLKLTPVTNRSVIENLMKDKSKKLFYFNKVQCGSQTKTVIQEVKLNFDARQAITQRSVTNDDGKSPVVPPSSTVTSSHIPTAPKSANEKNRHQWERKRIIGHNIMIRGEKKNYNYKLNACHGEVIQPTAPISIEQPNWLEVITGEGATVTSPTALISSQRKSRSESYSSPEQAANQSSEEQDNRLASTGVEKTSGAEKKHAVSDSDHEKRVIQLTAPISAELADRLGGEMEEIGEPPTNASPTSCDTEDIADLEKLDSFLLGSKKEDDGDDLTDLEKLDMFFKRNIETESEDSDFASEASFTM